jgi:hypothetical protein
VARGLSATLSGALVASATGTTDYTRLARQILSQRRFEPAPLPRPLHGVLNWLGQTFRPEGRAISNAFSAVAGVLPGGGATVWVLLGGGIVVLAGVLATRTIDRALVASSAPGSRLGDAAGSPDARALELAADAAERDGRFEQAVRLRFQAGLLRLDELGVLAYRPSLPNAAVSRRLRSPVFDGLLRRFEEVAYGGRQAAADDAGRARDGWQRVLADARRR